MDVGILRETPSILKSFVSKVIDTFPKEQSQNQLLPFLYNVITRIVEPNCFSVFHFDFFRISVTSNDLDLFKRLPVDLLLSVDEKFLPSHSQFQNILLNLSVFHHLNFQFKRCRTVLKTYSTLVETTTVAMEKLNFVNNLFLSTNVNSFQSEHGYRVPYQALSELSQKNLTILDFNDKFNKILNTYSEIFSSDNFLSTLISFPLVYGYRKLISISQLWGSMSINDLLQELQIDFDTFQAFLSQLYDLMNQSDLDFTYSPVIDSDQNTVQLKILNNQQDRVSQKLNSLGSVLKSASVAIPKNNAFASASKHSSHDAYQHFTFQ
ncbi:hypothetical protein GEMRC1_007201 [Eukaryota sp. GEM-RC1]